MKCPLASVLGDERGPVSMKLDDLPTSQTPEQTRSPKVLKGNFETAAEQSLSIPAKFGRTPRPEAGDKSLAVVHENTPPPNRNTR
jgi:hypothetical protein